MSQTVLLDANILYSASLRDVFMQLALAGLFRVRWSDEIHEEWINALARNRPQADRQLFERIRDLMNQAILDATITDYADLIPTLNLPDPDDRHVVAAAITGKCTIIVTKNMDDFPKAVLDPLGIEVISPDQFLLPHLQQTPKPFYQAIATIRQRLKNPPYSVEMYLELLKNQGLIQTATVLADYREHL